MDDIMVVAFVLAAVVTLAGLHLDKRSGGSDRRRVSVERLEALAQEEMASLWDHFKFCPDCGHEMSEHFHSAACVVDGCWCNSPTSAVIRAALRREG